MTNGALKYFVLIIVFACFSCKEEAKLASSETKKALKKPNIIVLLCDDLGYGDLSSYGHPKIQTSNIDKLAVTGIKLTNFYSAAQFVRHLVSVYLQVGALIKLGCTILFLG